MIIILLGAPGSGKGTQCQALSEREGFTHMSTGNILRAEIAAGTPVGQKAAPYLAGGKLVPDAIMIEMVAGRIEKGGQYLLDGFPRTVEQARALDEMLSRNGACVDRVFYLTLPEDEAIRRMTSRRTCSKCNEVYNAISRPTKVDLVCDKCGGPVSQREDDSEATARKRLMVFESLTQPLAGYYRALRLLTEIDAARRPEQVLAALTEAIRSAKAGTA